MSKRKAVQETKGEPVVKRKQRCCLEHGCKTRPTFGLEWGKATHCFDHALDGMQDVINKRCLEPGCKFRPSFGLEWGKATHCFDHALDCMENVISKRCQEPGCKKQPTFGLEWGKATRCFDHALDDMQDVISKRCLEHGCKTRPTFGLEWGKATHCFDHALDGMENVISKRCQEHGCKIKPSFGLEWGKPTHCSDHALDGMENVINKRCQEPGCKKQPTFGLEWGKATHCSNHALNGMENVTSKRCQEPGCKTRATFGLEWGKATHCFDHALDDMQDVINKRCLEPGCKTGPRYGNHMTGRAFCAAHRDKAQHWKLTTCKQSGCRRFATHSETGGFPFTFCDNHAPEGFSSCKEQRCLGCGFMFLCDEEQLCLFSCTSKHQDYVKRTENSLSDFLQKKGVTFIRDSAPAGSCTRRRPDFVFQTPYGVILVENDENQHKSNLCTCEQSRMIELHQSFGEAVHFIRFNPDRFVQSSTGKTGFVELPKRHVELYKILQKLLKNPQHFFQAHSALSARYMYYDNCDTEEHFQVVNNILY